MKRIRIASFATISLFVISGSLSGWAVAEEYKTFSEAYSKGTKLLRERQDAAAREPLEAALKLATDDEQRKNVYQALTRPYRLLPEIDKMLEAQEFIIRHTDRHAGRSNAARDVVSFLHQRGKLDAGAERYEAELKKNPEDPAAVTILAEVYAQHRKGDEAAPTYRDRREKLDRKLAEELATSCEKAAQADPATASWNLKEAAQAWLEVDDKNKALAAAKLSAAGEPERRTPILSFFWHEGLGQVFHRSGDPKAAILQYELAIPLAPSQLHVDQTEKKLAAARKEAEMQ